MSEQLHGFLGLAVIIKEGSAKKLQLNISSLVLQMIWS